MSRLLITLLFQALLLGQDLPWYRRNIGAGLPANPCILGAAYVRTDVAEVYTCFDSTWVRTYPADGGAGGVPAGSILLIVSGACPTGFAEETTLNGKTLLGTLAANLDVGGTGGSDAITPTGTVSQPTFTGNVMAGHSHTFTGTGLSAHAHAPGTYVNGAVSGGTPAGTVAWPAGVPTFAGNAVSGTLVSGGTPAGTNATSTVTPLGSVAAPVISWPAGVPTFAGAALASHTHTGASTTASPKLVTGNTSSGVTVVTGGPSITLTPAGTVAWPAGVPTNTAPAFTGSSSTVAAQVFTGSLLATHQHSTTATGTNSWPAGVPTFAGAALGTHNHTISGSSESVSGGTPAGTLDSMSAGTPGGVVSQPTFTGTQFDNRSAWAKVIFCKKT